ncbi:phage protein [Vibrio agarivorans]|uniref:DUF3653 domain-containing protein n=1 Tax=Vibrio agarivorans TaxID=153622 RepID=A0ABT7XZ97_9VIBR|nr:phage protein [Vibrio agarivorans]MDN2481104.1 DUF3653 domain-containing protein [Vibrio agarivorans]
MFDSSFRQLLFRNFDCVQSAADWFHVKPITVQRWLDGTSHINPMAEKLLIIKALGYLPNDNRWSGFRLNEEKAIFITPEGREFSPKELTSFAVYKDEYNQLVERYGRIEAPKIYPAKENLPPFRGGRRNQAAIWIPSKLK